MRLSFANGEHADFPVDGQASLGSAEGNTLVLHGGEVAPRHARLTVDARGIVLEVLEPAAQTHVNARPVREKALLRCGDVLCLGRVALTLKTGPDEGIQAPPSTPLVGHPSEPAEVVLRGVSGSHFGRCIAVNPRLVVGRDRDCGLRIDEPQLAPRRLAIETAGGAIYLRGIKGAGGVRVNGIQASDAIIYPGDQLTIGRSQFLVEAPSLPRRGQDALEARAITETLVAVPDDGGAALRRGRSGIWWLLGAAALLALLSVLLIQRGP
jgi:pSer/pThr/pTyr-binding forkhead associated (FHA) protein